MRSELKVWASVIIQLQVVSHHCMDALQAKDFTRPIIKCMGGMKPSPCQGNQKAKWLTASNNSVSEVSLCDVLLSVSEKLTDPVGGWLAAFS